jgi:hypothetical protein
MRRGTAENQDHGERGDADARRRRLNLPVRNASDQVSSFFDEPVAISRESQ